MVHVFKTSVKNKKQAKTVRQLLDSLINPNGAWNFDLQDCDRILRVEKFSNSKAIITIMQGAGFACEELED